MQLFRSKPEMLRIYAQRLVSCLAAKILQLSHFISLNFGLINFSFNVIRHILWDAAFLSACFKVIVLQVEFLMLKDYEWSSNDGMMADNAERTSSFVVLVDKGSIVINSRVTVAASEVEKERPGMLITAILNQVVHEALAFKFPYRLTADQISDLEKTVSSDEIRKAVWSCGENKSPGPDGFTFEFFRKYWDSIGPDMCVAMNTASHSIWNIRVKIALGTAHAIGLANILLDSELNPHLSDYGLASLVSVADHITYGIRPVESVAKLLLYPCFIDLCIIEILLEANHENFVNLIGYCEEQNHFTRMMVFEYASNGTLFEHLHNKFCIESCDKDMQGSQDHSGRIDEERNGESMLWPEVAGKESIFELTRIQAERRL
ncbi:RNA-directed DNA polymerase, eukaryota [Tanacetum coccineum]